MVSPQPDLVTVATAAHHLKLPVPASLSDAEADLQGKVDAATAIILEYLDRDDEDWTAEMVSWTTSTVPHTVKQAILLQVGELYRFRGDDPSGHQPAREHGYLHPAIVAVLHRWRDPSVA